MPSKKNKKKTDSKKKKTPPKKAGKKSDSKKKKTPPKKKESTTKPNYGKWTKDQLINELNAVMDILETKGKVLKVEKLVEVPTEVSAHSTPSGPFEIEVMMISGASVTLKNPNDIVGFLKGQGLVREAVVN